jgi:hypothetical protein
MTLINENDYFVESKKAIQVVLQHEKRLEKEMKPADKLQLVKERKDETKIPEEFEELEKLEKELERKIRFNQTRVPAIPEKYRKTVKKNAVAEELEVNNKLNELKGELKEKIEYLETEVLPLIDAINKLEAMKGIPKQIDTFLEAEMGEGAPVSMSYVSRILTVSNNEAQSGKAIKKLKGVIDSLKKIEVPVETKGLLNFLKRGKK